MHGEPADQVDQLRAGPGPLDGAVFDADRQLGARAALPDQLDARGIPLAVDVQHDVVEQRAQQFLAVPVGCALSVPHPAEFAGETSQRAPFWLGQRGGTMPVKLGEREPLALDIG